VKSRVRFEDEADAEYRLAGRWYEERREHLGIEFFDAVDTTIDRIVAMPQAGTLVPRMPADSRFDAAGYRDFRTMSCTLRRPPRSEFSRLPTTAGSLGIGRAA